VSDPKRVIVCTTKLSKPVISAATNINTPTPITTPNTVRKLRILCWRKVSSARSTLSL
jgi:hypothetical protein